MLANYVRAMWLMLQQDEPDDYVVAAGERTASRSSYRRRVLHLDLDWKQHVVQDRRFYRPAEVDLLVGDPEQGGREARLNRPVDFRQLCASWSTPTWEIAAASTPNMPFK